MKVPITAEKWCSMITNAKDRISFYTAPFPTVNSYYSRIDAAVAHGLSLVEGLGVYEFENPDVEEARKVRAYADSKGVRFCCFSVFCNLVGDDSAQMVERLKKYAEVAAALGSPFLHHTIACDYSNPDNVLPHSECYFERGINAVRQIYDYAETLGVRTIYEDQGYLFNGVENFARFLCEVDRNVGVVADFGNVYQSKDDIKAFIKAFAPRVCHVHIKDVLMTETNERGNGLKTLKGNYMNEVPIGEGCIDFPGAINMLKEVGYSGNYAFEFTTRAEEDGTMDKAIEYFAALI